MKKIIVFPLILFIFGNVLSQRSYYGSEIKLSPIHRTSEEFILPAINHINSCDNYFIAYNSKQCIFYVFDKSLRFVTKFGTKGKGPREFLWPARIVIVDTVIYIWDYVKQSIFQYSILGNYINKIGLKEPSGEPSTFCLIDNHFYFHDLGEYPIVVINSSGERVKGFGKFYPPYENIYEKYFNNSTLHLLSYRKSIIAVNGNHALISQYDLNGQLMRERKYKDLEKLFLKIAEYTKRSMQVKGRKITFIMIPNCIVDGNRLFLILNGSPGSSVDKVITNTLLVIDLKSLEIIATLRLPGRFYLGMAVNNHLCLAYNYIDAVLEMFRIPDELYK